MLGVNLMNSVDGLAGLTRRYNVIDDVNAFYHKNLVLEFYLAGDIGCQLAGACVDLARFQRAAKCACQSAACCGDNIVQRGCVGLEGFGADTVVLGDLPMNAEDDRLGFRGEVGAAHRPRFTLNSNFGDVHWGWHKLVLSCDNV